MNISDTTMLKKLALELENAINAALTMSPNSQKHLKRLTGCILEIFISSTKQSFYFGVKQSEDHYQVVLLPKQESSSVQLSGSALSFFKLASTLNKSSVFRSREIKLSGDSVRSEQIQLFLNSTNIDWEGLFASVIGDVPAHIVGNTLRNSLSWGKMFSQSLIRDVEEFIKYEVRLLPGKAVATKQFAAIDQLYQATKNLELKIKERISSQEIK